MHGRDDLVDDQPCPGQDAGEFFSSFYVTGSNAFGISLGVIGLGILIGLIGSTIGLRRFLRV